MRNKITKKAIEKAGGVSALAKALKISVPSVSAWHRIPINRVVLVEKITGISRHSLRPDIFERPIAAE